MDLTGWIILAVVVVVAWRILRQRQRPSEPETDGEEIAPGIRFEMRFVPAPLDDRERVDMRAPLATGYSYLIQGPPVSVVGESRYRNAIEGYVGRRADGHKTIVDAALVAEPDNPHDANAIAVEFGGQRVGYLSRGDAIRYKPVMDWCRAEGFIPVVRGDVRGGWQEDDGTWADFGITLYVASPEKLLGRAPVPMPVPRVDHEWAGQLIAFTGDSRCVIGGNVLDREASMALAQAAGLTVHERVTKKVQLLVDCDTRTISGNQRKAIEYGIPVIDELDFWTRIGIEAQR